MFIVLKDVTQNFVAPYLASIFFLLTYAWLEEKRASIIFVAHTNQIFSFYIHFYYYLFWV